MPALKAGPLTVADIQAVWEGSVDGGYSAPFVRAGNGAGFEAWSQVFEQMARASRAIDISTQAMFVASHSGQTSPPAAGAAKSIVTLEFARGGFYKTPLVLGKGGKVLVEEKTTDWGEQPVEVLTGRRYTLLSDLAFLPGDSGPFEVQAEAELPGYGYDNPLPGTLIHVPQPASQFNNDVATVVIENAGSVAGPGLPPRRTVVIADDQPDMFVPEHVGQYLQFTAGANVGRVVRILEFVPPDSTTNTGSGVVVENAVAIVATAFVGTFQVGELVAFSNGGPVLAYARLVGFRTSGSSIRMVLTFVNGAATMGSNLLGATSGATASGASVLSDYQIPVAEAPSGGVGGASWRILTWENDWVLTVTNAASPSGGKSAMLDELGSERKVGRAPGEPDSTYRARVRTISDVVSPNAIRRAVSRTFFPHAFMLREAGQATWPGFFYDGDLEPPSTTPGRPLDDAYDTDVIEYAGTLTGSFLFQEPVIVEDDAFLFFASGYAGRFDASSFVLVRKNGSYDPPAAGGTIHVRGLYSGARFDVASASIPPQVEARRYHTYLDYEQFRAFFWIELERLGDGEFGFAYDGVATPNAWDVGFFDGFPHLAADVYLRVYRAVYDAHAGGVGFEFLRMPSGPFPVPEPYVAPLPDLYPEFDGDVPIFAWYAVNSTLGTGSNVDSVSDESGNGHVLTAQLGHEPQYTPSDPLYNDNPTWTFPKSGLVQPRFNYAALGVANGGPFSLYFVGHTTAAGTNMRGLSNTGGPYMNVYAPNGGGAVWHVMESADIASARAADVPSIVYQSIDGPSGTVRMSVNSPTQESSSTSAEYVDFPGCVGTYAALPTFESLNWGGTIAAVLAFSGVDSPAKRATRMAALGAKFGIVIV